MAGWLWTQLQSQQQQQRRFCTLPADVRSRFTRARLQKRGWFLTESESFRWRPLGFRKGNLCRTLDLRLASAVFSDESCCDFYRQRYIECESDASAPVLIGIHFQNTFAWLKIEECFSAPEQAVCCDWLVIQGSWRHLVLHHVWGYVCSLGVIQCC